MTSMLTANATVTTNMSTDTAQQVSVDMSGLAHIMSVLTNLYSNTSLAVLREYSVNALDSHVEAGVDAPIEVVLPSDLNPTLYIRDFGVGMSEADIYCIYAQYGASTKRDDETQVGGFGLGCKSALALTQQFTVTAIQNGQKTVVYFAQGSNGIPTVDTLLRVETDEPNGVEVAIPVDDVLAMVREAKGFFAVWKPGTVLVNGQPPQTVWDAFTKVADGAYLATGNEEIPFAPRERYLVMGSVPYPLDSSILRTLVDSINSRFHIWTENLLLEVGIGDVDITPSRESLNYSEKTKNAITERLIAFFDNVHEFAKTHVNDSVTPAQAVQRATYWSTKGWLPAYSESDYTWQGRPVPLKIALQETVNAVEYANGVRTVVRSGINQVFLTSASQRRLIIHGISTPDHRYRLTRDIRDYAKKVYRSLDSGVGLFADAGRPFEENPWFEDVEGGIFDHVSIEEIMEKAREYRRETRRSSSTTRSGNRASISTMVYPVLQVHSDGTSELTERTMQELSEAKNDLFYYSGESDFKRDLQRYDSTKNFFTSLMPVNSTLIIVEHPRASSALVRRLPVVQSLRAQYTRVAKEFIASLTPLQTQVIATDPYCMRKYRYLVDALGSQRSRIKNKSFLRVLDIVDTDNASFDVEKARSMRALLQNYRYINSGAYSDLVMPAFAEGEQQDFLNSYPLLERAFADRHTRNDEKLISHAIMYLNSIA